MTPTTGTSGVRPSPPGRPRSFDEAAVLDAALELFWRHGYRATTTRELEAVSGVSQSSLYNAFGSKAGLLASALDRYEAMIDDRILRPLEESQQGLAAIDDFLDSLGRWITTDGRRGCMIINLMAEDAGDSREITERTGRYRARVREALRAAVLRAARFGETHLAGIEDRAEVVFGMVLGLNIAARGGASGAEIAGLLAAAHHVVGAWRTPHPPGTS